MAIVAIQSRTGTIETLAVETFAHLLDAPFVPSCRVRVQFAVTAPPAIANIGAVRIRITAVVRSSSKASTGRGDCYRRIDAVDRHVRPHPHCVSFELPLTVVKHIPATYSCEIINMILYFTVK